MSYIAFELDALNVAPAVARSARVGEEIIISGLVRMWAWCFREKTDTITADQLRGHFGADVAPALVAFRFLEAAGDSWRVRGAQRYLRISEARSKGGKAASGNLKRGTAQPEVQPGVSPGSSPAPAGSQPGVSPGCGPALTPSTEHRAPNTEKDSPPASRARLPKVASPNPRPRETDDLCTDFRQATGADYRWNGAVDGTAFAKLRKEFSLEEIRTRWRTGLNVASGWLAVRTVAQLASKWNDLASGPPKQRDAFDPNQGILRAEKAPPCVGCGAAGVSGWPELEVPTCHACAGEAVQWSEDNNLVPYVDGATRWFESRKAAA